VERVLPLLKAVPYIRLFQGGTFVVKVSGSLLEDPDALGAVTEDVAVLHHLGVKVVVVHGGGPQMDRMAERLGVRREVHAGRRVTDDATLDLAKMVFRGRLNCDLGAALRGRGLLPVGLSGADGGLLTAVRRPPVPVTDPGTGRSGTLDFGHVGDVVAVDPSLISRLLDGGFVPVVCSLAATERGELLNVNADTVAAELGASLGAMKVILGLRGAGLFDDLADPSSLRSYVDLPEVDEIVRKGGVTGGMLPKLAAAAVALRKGVPRVHLVDAFRPHALLLEVFTNEGCGTLIVKDKAEEPPIPAGVV